jgi:hypothetical protein
MNLTRSRIATFKNKHRNIKYKIVYNKMFLMTLIESTSILNRFIHPLLVLFYLIVLEFCQ